MVNLNKKEARCTFAACTHCNVTSKLRHLPVFGSKLSQYNFGYNSVLEMEYLKFSN